MGVLGGLLLPGAWIQKKETLILGDLSVESASRRDWGLRLPWSPKSNL